MKIATFYNHKGGVSKTITTFNLANYLVEQGKKVLVVDADPQCNMTEVCLSNLIVTLDEEAEKTGTDKDLPGTSLLEILTPRLDGEISSVDVGKIQVVTVKEGLDLIRGSVDLNSIEDKLAEAHNQRFSTKVHEKRNYVAIGDMLLRFGETGKYDYVFIDVGPSSGALTRSCFLAADVFAIPVAADRFNIQAIKTLSKIVDRWMFEHGQIYDDFKSLGLPVRIGRPKFAGVVVQFHKLYRGKPKPGFKMWMERIPEVVNNFLLPVLNKHSINNHVLADSSVIKKCIVAEISDFGSLATIMHETGKAVFQITQKDTSLIDENGKKWTGPVWDGAKKRMSLYKASFKKIANRFEVI